MWLADDGFDGAATVGSWSVFVGDIQQEIDWINGHRWV
jgi:hypothetical protein